MKTLTRAQVYSLIDTERRYQDMFIANNRDRTDVGENETHTPGEYLTMLAYYLSKAQEAWTVKPGDTAALDVVRKIAGIAVHCMEDHGAPPRILPVEVSSMNKQKPKKRKIIRYSELQEHQS